MYFLSKLRQDKLNVKYLYINLPLVQMDQIFNELWSWPLVVYS